MHLTLNVGANSICIVLTVIKVHKFCGPEGHTCTQIHVITYRIRNKVKERVQSEKRVDLFEKLVHVGPGGDIE